MARSRKWCCKLVLKPKEISMDGSIRAVNSSYAVTAVHSELFFPFSLLSILSVWEILWRVEDVLCHSGRGCFWDIMTLAIPKLFLKLLKLLIRADLCDIWVNQRTWINNMHKCISNRGWLMHEGSGYFFPLFYHPEDASTTSCVLLHCVCMRACACNPTLTTAGNETKPSYRFVTLSLLGARCGLARGQSFVFTLIYETWKNLYETKLLFGS